MTAIACPCVPSLCPPPRKSDDAETGLGGLVALATGEALPLREVKVRTEIVGPCARTVVEQRFGNALTYPVEAVHIFPLPPNGAVVEMELHAGDTVVVAECREREEAVKTFDAARHAGHRAALLTQERADVHTLRVTRIPPGAEIRVRMVIIQALEAQDGLYRFRFPTVVAPRYHSGTPIGHSGPGVDPDTDRVPDASRLSPPLRLAGGTRLDLEVEIQGPVGELSASSHAVAMKLSGGRVRVAPSVKATLDRDFVLAFGLADAQETALRAYTDGHCTLVVACAPRERVPAAMPRDAVFVVDISGSMDGIKMVAAKAALTAALHGLLPGDRFRLIAFDDRLEHFRADFVEYGDASLAAADGFIAALQPRGGTEMLPAIQAALSGATAAGRLRTVLFVTDGQATNEAELVAAVANRRGAARFFTLGIDTAVNEALMSRLARVGGGVCEIATPEDDIEETVARLESRFGLPLVDGLRVENADAARPEPAVLFAGRPASILLAGSPASVTVRGVAAGGDFVAQAVPERVEFPLSALWARERVAFLEDRLVLKPFEEEALRGDILRLGLAHHLATRFTAFVAVERQTTVAGDQAEIVQPVELPHGWSEDFGGAGAVTRAGSLGGMPGGGAMLRAAPPPSLSRSMSAPMSPSPAMPVSAPSPSKPMPRAESAPKGGGLFDKAVAMAKRALAPKEEAAAPAAQGRGFWDDEAESPTDAGTADAFCADEDDGADDVSELAAPLAAFDMADAEAAPAPEPTRQTATSASQAAATLARTQGADGSFGGDVARTAAALLALVLLGHTRRSGARSRVVLKAATWLESHRGEPAVDAALTALASAERGEKPIPEATWTDLRLAGPEGALLVAVEADAG